MLIDKNILNDMGERLRQKVKKDYLWSESSNEHIKIFAEIINT